MSLGGPLRARSWGALAGLFGFASGFFGLLLFFVGGLFGGFGLVEGCLAG